MHNFKNDGQMEMLTFPKFFIKMLNYSILDHIYGLNQHYPAFFSAECLKIKVKACALNWSFT